MGIENKTDQATGKVREEIGKATGDKDLENDGQAQKIEGKIGDTADRAKDKITDAADDVADKVKDTADDVKDAVTR